MDKHEKRHNHNIIIQLFIYVLIEKTVTKQTCVTRTEKKTHKQRRTKLKAKQTHGTNIQLKIT